MTAKTKTPCFCSSFEFGTTVDLPDGDVDFQVAFTTECTEVTSRTFAMGHDAKLATALVRAELEGLEITSTNGGVVTDSGGAVRTAAAVSDRLAAKVQAMMERAVAKLAKAQLRADAKAARKSAPKTPKYTDSDPAQMAPAPVPTTREATIKVGRWEYPATIEIATGNATFTKKSGETQLVVAGRFTEVA